VTTKQTTELRISLVVEIVGADRIRCRDLGSVTKWTSAIRSSFPCFINCNVSCGGRSAGRSVHASWACSARRIRLLSALRPPQQQQQPPPTTTTYCGRISWSRRVSLSHANFDSIVTSLSLVPTAKCAARDGRYIVISSHSPRPSSTHSSSFPPRVHTTMYDNQSTKKSIRRASSGRGEWVDSSVVRRLTTVELKLLVAQWWNILFSPTAIRLSVRSLYRIKSQIRWHPAYVD